MIFMEKYTEISENKFGIKPLIIFSYDLVQNKEIALSLQSLNPVVVQEYPIARGASKNASRTRIVRESGSAVIAAAVHPAWNLRQKSL